MKRPVQLLVSLTLAASLTSCSLITAPLRLIGRTANSLINSVGGVGGAASLAPLLLDAKESQPKPVRGQKRDLKGDLAPSQRLERKTEVVRGDTTVKPSEG